MGVTPCQFDSDLRHHGFRHENAPQTKICGASFLPTNGKVSELFRLVPLQQICHRIHRMLLHVRQDVRIQIQGDAYVGMVEMRSNRISAMLRSHASLILAVGE